MLGWVVMYPWEFAFGKGAQPEVNLNSVVLVLSGVVCISPASLQIRCFLGHWMLPLKTKVHLVSD